MSEINTSTLLPVDVAFSTGYGDGAYPVYVKLNEDNRVTKVVIDFEGDVDPDE